MTNKQIDTLLEAAKYCTQERNALLIRLEHCAYHTLYALDDLEPRDAETIGKSDVLERLQRNSHSLHYLLSMAAQVAECMNSELCDIFRAQDQFDQERADSKMDRWKEIYYAEQRKESDRKYREKSKTLKTED